MEKVLHPYDKERMRLAMLKHEETFREQVYELHRLYQIQKMLMDSNSAGISQQQQRQNPFTICHQTHHPQRQDLDPQSNKSIKIVMGLIDQRPDDQPGVRSNGQQHINVEIINSKLKLDENDIELSLSLGPSAHSQRGVIRTDKSESGQTHSSSSTGSNQTRKAVPKNSSLLGRAEDHDHPLTWDSSSGFPQGSETEPGFSNGQQTNPPWLFHALSLKLT